MPLPRVAISMGDPGGVGPEIIVRALARDDVRQVCNAVVVGSAEVLGATAEMLKLHLPGRVVRTKSDWAESHELLIHDIETHYPLFHVGKVSQSNGQAAYQWIVQATQLVLDGNAHALCTAPISKEAIYAAGVEFPGHTELLAHLCGGCEVRMMLAGGGLNAVLQTIHVPLRDVPSLLDESSIARSLEIISNWWQQHAGGLPRIAVCGLNPHAGEAGHIGREDIEIIAPAIRAAAARGLQATGPYPADTVFHRALQGDFDVVLAMYHDQALIPVKTLDFHGGVNLTLGLPIIRTSPDHGTAFEIAGKRKANESSMVAAIKRAAQLASHTAAR
jgi:4-hydroxythreonine-4-phosphate dehydrogenase